MPETTPSSVSRQDLRAEVPGAKWAYAIELGASVHGRIPAGLQHGAFIEKQGLLTRDERQRTGPAARASAGSAARAVRPREREYAIHDTTLQGFVLRVQPNGARSWAFRYRRDGKPHRVTLGKPGAMKADEARAAALAFLAREKGGGKPLPPLEHPLISNVK